MAGPIDHADLERFPKLPHDFLSDYTFPGASRLRNYIMAVRLAEGAPGAHAIVFISLMDNGGVEVRIIAPGAESGGEGLFGVFQLTRQQP